MTSLYCLYNVNNIYVTILKCTVKRPRKKSNRFALSDFKTDFRNDLNMIN